MSVLFLKNTLKTEKPQTKIAQATIRTYLHCVLKSLPFYFCNNFPDCKPTNNWQKYSGLDLGQTDNNSV